MPVPQSVPLSLKENHTDLRSTPNSCYLLATNFEELTFPALGLSFFTSKTGILPPTFAKRLNEVRCSA